MRCPIPFRVLAVPAAALAALVLCAGCARAPVPFYDDGDIAPNPGLAGCWCPAGEQDRFQLTLTPRAGSRFRLRCSGECEPLQAGRDYTLTPFALDGQDYIDLVLQPAGDEDEEPLTPHTVFRVDQLGGGMAFVALLAPRAVRDAVDGETCGPALVGEGDEVVILTDTDGLRELLRRHGHAIFDVASPFTRCEETGE